MSAETTSRPWRRLGAMALVWAGVAAFAWLALGTPGGTDTDGWVVRRGDLVSQVPVNGTLEAASTLQLGPPAIPGIWQYKIAMMAPEGTQVTPGQPVLAFDTTELTRNLLTKAAERDSAASELEQRRTELERELRQAELALARAEASRVRAELKIDVPEDLVGRNELAQTRLDLDLARREEEHQRAKIDLLRRRARAETTALVEKRDRAAARVREIEEQLQRMMVTAPTAGTVVYVADWRGEKRKVGDQVWQLHKVLEIPDLTRMRGRAEVDEADAGKVEMGQEVALRLDAQPDTEYRAEVTRVHRTVQPPSPGSPRRVVRLDLTLAGLERSDARLRPGMRFRGDLVVERRDDVLWVPSEALTGTSDGPVAHRRTWKGVEAIPVEVGLRGGETGERIEITGGLREGERLTPAPEEGG